MTRDPLRFVLTLQAKPDVDPIRALRMLLRQCGLRCTSIERAPRQERHEQEPEDPR
jgi:hypothetical protein